MAQSDLDIEELSRKLSVGFWSIRLEGEQMNWSRAISEIHGLPHDPNPPLTYGARAITPDHWENLRRAFFDCVEAGLSYDIEVELERLDGEIRWVRMYGEPIYDHSGDIVGARGAMQDIDQYRADRSEAAADRNGFDVAGEMAHAFSNLLTVMLSNAALISAAIEEPALVEMAEDLLEAGDRAAAISNAVLLSCGRQTLVTTNVNLGTLLESLQIGLQRLAGGTKVRLRDADAKAIVNLDPLQFEDALQAVVQNSCDALATRVEISLTRNADHAVVEVADNGEGIDDAIAERATAPFVTTRHGTGRGLGLTLSSSVVRECGGSFSIRATDRGTVATFELPILADAAEAEAAKSIPIPRGATALVVDDDEVVLRSVAREVRQLGLTVITADSGADALDRFEDEEIDLLITDIVMPAMSGVELAREALKRFPDLPIVFASARTRELWELQNGEFDGVMATVRKPARGRRLRNALQAVFARTAMSGESDVPIDKASSSEGDE